MKFATLVSIMMLFAKGYNFSMVEILEQHSSNIMSFFRTEWKNQRLCFGLS